jgi:hypothetical protein
LIEATSRHGCLLALVQGLGLVLVLLVLVLLVLVLLVLVLLVLVLLVLVLLVQAHLPGWRRMIQPTAHAQVEVLEHRLRGLPWRSSSSRSKTG